MKFFIKSYYMFLIIYELLFKKVLYFYSNIYIYIFYRYMNINNTCLLLSRIYRSLRLTFFYKNLFLIKKFKKSYRFFTNKNLTIVFYSIFEYFLIRMFRFLKQNRICLYGYRLKNGLKLIWIDFFSFLKAIDELILYRESFFFKYDIFKLIYSLNLLVNFERAFIIFSYYGFNFVFLKKKFKYKFYMRLL